MSNFIDLAFIAAKLATLNNEKEKIVVDSVSFVYNVAQIARLKSLVSEYAQICSCVIYQSQLRGFYTQDEYNIVMQCKQHIEDCNREISKHGVMSLIDGISLLVEGFSSLDKK